MPLKLCNVLEEMIAAIPDQGINPSTTLSAAGLRCVQQNARSAGPEQMEDLMYEAIGIALDIYPDNQSDVQPWMEYVNDLLVEYHRQERGYITREVPKPPAMKTETWRDRSAML